MKPRLTWRKQPNETRLAKYFQSPRGYYLMLNGERIGTVAPQPTGHLAGSRQYDGWYWYCRCDERGIPLKNTANRALPTIEEAKAECMAYAKAWLERSRQ